MEIRRFFVSPNKVLNGTVVIDGSEFNHLTKVLRYKVGYLLTVCDNTGAEYDCTLISINKDNAVCRIDQKKDGKVLPTDITLYMCLSRSDRFDFILQKAVELGAKRIVPVMSEYSTEKDINRDRQERIILEACKQCGLAIVPELASVMTFEEAVDAEGKNAVMFYEKEGRTLINGEVLRGRNSIIVGSEGGFSEKEAQYAVSHGVITVSLGKRILRTETAAVSALTLTSYLKGGMDL